MAKNMVIAGDCQGKGVGISVKGVFITTKIMNPLYLTKENVESYEVITEEAAKSAASGAVRGIIGGAILGPVGMLAGSLSAKSKNTIVLAIQFKDGKRSLMEVDSNIYKNIMQMMF